MPIGAHRVHLLAGVLMAAAPLRSFLPLALVVLVNVHHSLLASAGAVYNVAYFGARPDAGTDASTALLRAWSAACRCATPATVFVPRGTFLVRQATFTGPCRNSMITFQIDGTIVSPRSFTKSSEWMAFDNVDGVSIVGGTIDGKGASLWSCKSSKGRSCPAGARSLAFRNSQNIVISDLTSVDSELYHIVIDGCRDVRVQGVKISAPSNSPNTDGIHVQGSTGVTIIGAGIGTGDDCVSVGPGTTNLWIEQVACGPGHGISIGSLGKEYQEQGVENVTVTTTVFVGTQNGLRIKTWGRPSSGFVKNVLFEHSVMRNVENPIIITQSYCPDHKDCPGQNSGVKISQVTYDDIRGSSATPVGVELSCSRTNPCRGIGLHDIRLTYGNRPAQATCKYAGGVASGFVMPPSCL